MTTYQSPQDATTGKLVATSLWFDLTANITTAGPTPTSNPGAVTVTITTSTGTFDGATIPCNAFAWTTSAATRDGYSEMTTWDLGAVTTYYPAYNPDVHIIQLEVDVVTVGTLNAASPIINLALVPGGTFSSETPIAGYTISNATSLSQLVNVSTTTNSGGITAINPASVVARATTRRWPVFPDFAYLLSNSSANLASPITATVAFANYTTGDKIYLLLGQSTVTVGAISGLKARCRFRVLAQANLDLSDVDLGVQL